jgi:hypothetical protein
MLMLQDYPWFEGGGTWKSNGVYYTQIGTDCCFCQWGGSGGKSQFK